MLENIKFVDDKFFLNDTLTMARKLIGKILVRENNQGAKIGGRIIETEAYLAENDLASHSNRGITNRNAPMYAAAGSIYVYRIYGIHLCLNISTDEEGIGAAVLLRSLEQLIGREEMQNNRKGVEIKNICNGPGNLTKSIGVELEDNYKRINQSNYFLYSDETEFDIIATPRIGISKAKELPYRFIIKC